MERRAILAHHYVNKRRRLPEDVIHALAQRRNTRTCHDHQIFLPAAAHDSVSNSSLHTVNNLDAETVRIRNLVQFKQAIREAPSTKVSKEERVKESGKAI
uniref:Uncharacterized protein n=1 Tax=Acrobeloides nanus TaxID=290746 RepID=A0A914C951_9BILA